MNHQLVLDPDRLHRSKCFCGALLAPLLPHFPTVDDVTKAFLLHEAAEAARDGG